MDFIEVIGNLLQELDELELSNLQIRMIGFEFLRQLIEREPYQLNENWEEIITKHLSQLEIGEKEPSYQTQTKSSYKKRN